jgi:hypothetical protein
LEVTNPCPAYGLSSFEVSTSAQGLVRQRFVICWFLWVCLKSPFDDFHKQDQPTSP